MKRINILLISIILTLLTSCAAFFQPRVPMSFDGSGANLEDLLVEKTKEGQLATPSQVIASQNLDPSLINITWTSVPNAVSYRIEYAVVSPDKDGIYPTEITEDKYSILEESWYGTNYTHKITESALSDYNNRFEKHYFYRIIAKNTRDGFDESLPTPSTIYGTLFAPPKNVSATCGVSEDFINVSWDFVPGAKSYEIYRSESENGTGAVWIDTVLGNMKSYRDEITSPTQQGKEFYYIIYAVNRSGKKSNKSSIAMGYSLVPGAPGIPTGIKVVNGRGDSASEISLKWNSVPNVRYNVFRHTSKDTSVVRVGKNLTKSEFTDRDRLEPGIYYYYSIQALSTDEKTGEDQKSAFSEAVEGYILSAPSSVQAKKVDGGIQLIWEKAIGNAAEQAAYKYKVLASNELNGPFEEKLVTSDTNVLVGLYPFFKIITINSKEIESKESVTIAPAPDAAINVNVSRADYSFLGKNPVSNDFGVFPVKITWKKPENDTPYGYDVYRSQREDSGYRKINENVILGNSFVDTEASMQAGKVYYYKVLSVNVLGNGENFSDYQYGWGALTQERYMKEFNETILSSQKKLTLMHKPNSLDKIGSESKDGSISGNVYYNAAVKGAGAHIIMQYTDYADFYINSKKPDMGVEFKLTGNSDTDANMQSNGTMNGIIKCTGMYPGQVDYGKIEIKAGAAGGGTYGVTPDGYVRQEVSFSVVEEK